MFSPAFSLLIHIWSNILFYFVFTNAPFFKLVGEFFRSSIEAQALITARKVQLFLNLQLLLTTIILCYVGTSFMTAAAAAEFDLLNF